MSIMASGLLYDAQISVDWRRESTDFGFVLYLMLAELPLQYDVRYTLFGLPVTVGSDFMERLDG